MKSTEQIAQRLVQLCREAKWEAAQTELYAVDAVCIESQFSPVPERVTRGLPAIIEKGKQFDARVQALHSIKVSDPLCANGSFACVMELDVTLANQGRVRLKEVCVYEVKNGKVISEQFYL